MNRISAFLFILFAVYSCSRKDEVPPVLTHCDGLVTDTSGTGDNGRVYMPNGFTPNGDGLNDESKPLVQNISSLKFTITDERNRVVFTTMQIGVGWRPASASGVAARYYYRIEAVTAGGRHIGKCGEVYLMTCYPAGIPHSNFYFEDQLTPFGFTGVTAEHLSNCP